MANSGRKKGQRSPNLYRHFKGKQPELVRLLDQLNIDKRELNRMIRAKPGYMMRIFTHPLGSMRFKHLIALSEILEMSVGEVAELVNKDIDPNFKYKVRKDITLAREYAEDNRQRNLKNYYDKKEGKKDEDPDWDNY
jgi:hypothetical protein